MGLYLAMKADLWAQKGAVAQSVQPRAMSSPQVSELRRAATDHKQNQRAQLHLDQEENREWVHVAPVGSNTKAQ